MDIKITFTESDTNFVSERYVFREHIFFVECIHATAIETVTKFKPFTLRHLPPPLCWDVGCDNAVLKRKYVFEICKQKICHAIAAFKLWEAFSSRNIQRYTATRVQF